MRLIASIPGLVALLLTFAIPAMAQDVTISKGTNGEIVITGGKRTPPKQETPAEAEARRTAQERSFDTGTANVLRQQEMQERNSGNQSLFDKVPPPPVGMPRYDAAQTDIEVQGERAIYYERKVYKSRGAYMRARDKEMQERLERTQQKTQE